MYRGDLKRFYYHGIYNGEKWQYDPYGIHFSPDQENKKRMAIFGIFLYIGRKLSDAKMHAILIS